MSLQAAFLAHVVYAALFVPAFGARSYYVAFCALLLLAGGPEYLVYAPVLWLVPDILIVAPRLLKLGVW